MVTTSLHVVSSTIERGVHDEITYIVQILWSLMFIGLQSLMEFCEAEVILHFENVSLDLAKRHVVTVQGGVERGRIWY